MISTLTGTITHTSSTSAVLDVHGFGYIVNLTAPQAAAVSPGEAVTLHTTLIVRAESLALYGFADSEERALFDLLITVNGVGPRHALAALSALDPASLSRAIRAENDIPFRSVPGIGPKTARMIVMALRNKVTASSSDEPEEDSTTADESVAPTVRAEASAALLSLGWKQRTVNETLDLVLGASPSAAMLTTSALVRAALAKLASS